MREEEKREKNSLLATEISVARERERDAQEEYEEEERVREEEKKRKKFSSFSHSLLLFLVRVTPSQEPSLVKTGTRETRVADASGADMAETWLPRPVSSCRGVHVAASCAR